MTQNNKTKKECNSCCCCDDEITALLEKNKIPSETYFQYRRAGDMVWLFKSFGDFVNAYRGLLSTVSLGDFNNCQISGPLLKYVASCVYGINSNDVYWKKPKLSINGTIASFRIDLLAIDSSFVFNPPSTKKIVLSDDLLRRILTWKLYRDYQLETPANMNIVPGHGMDANGEYEFTVPWLKRRVARFLCGDGSQSIHISVRFGANRTVIISSWGVGDEKSITDLEGLINSPLLGLPTYYSYLYQGTISRPIAQSDGGKDIQTKVNRLLNILT